MTDKKLYKYYQYLIRQNIRDADLSKSLLVKYNELNATDLDAVERRQLRMQYLQLNDETNKNFYREKDAIHQIVCDMKPTHLQTITFVHNDYAEQHCHKTLETYLKKLNKKLFKRRTDAQLSVIPFQETNNNNGIHFHLLLKNPQELINNKKIDFESICRSVLRTMSTVDKVNTHDAKTFIELDYQEERFRKPTFYCLKESQKINDLPLVSDLMFYPH
jgi:hypothetical protein